MSKKTTALVNRLIFMLGASRVQLCYLIIFQAYDTNDIAPLSKNVTKKCIYFIVELWMKRIGIFNLTNINK